MSKGSQEISLVKASGENGEFLDAKPSEREKAANRDLIDILEASPRDSHSLMHLANGIEDLARRRARDEKASPRGRALVRPIRGRHPRLENPPAGFGGDDS